MRQNSLQRRLHLHLRQSRQMQQTFRFTAANPIPACSTDAADTPIIWDRSPTMRVFNIVRFHADVQGTPVCEVGTDREPANKMAATRYAIGRQCSRDRNCYFPTHPHLFKYAAHALMTPINRLTVVVTAIARN